MTIWPLGSGKHGGRQRACEAKWPLKGAGPERPECNRPLQNAGKNISVRRRPPPKTDPGRAAGPDQASPAATFSGRGIRGR